MWKGIYVVVLLQWLPKVTNLTILRNIFYQAAPVHEQAYIKHGSSVR